MGDVTVEYGESAAETAQALLDAADSLELDAGVVRTHSDAGGGFVVPEEVADEAGVDFEVVEVVEEGQAVEEDEEPLRGAELDEALEERGLPKTGKVAEKQARLAEYDAGQE
jgi:hypothetical protein